MNSHMNNSCPHSSLRRNTKMFSLSQYLMIERLKVADISIVVHERLSRDIAPRENFLSGFATIATMSELPEWAYTCTYYMKRRRREGINTRQPNPSSYSQDTTGAE